MIKSGRGGGHTKTGAIFEKIADLEPLFCESKNYKLNSAGKNYEIIKYKDKAVGFLFKQHGLYHYLKTRGINYKNYLSKKILPDNAIFVSSNNALNIIEMKYQTVPGSVDEKLQTCDFKRKQYQKLVIALKWNVEYIYILNDWFKHPQYKDTLTYITAVGCRYYFNKLPLITIGLET